MGKARDSSQDIYTIDHGVVCFRTDAQGLSGICHFQFQHISSDGSNLVTHFVDAAEDLFVQLMSGTF